MSAIPTFPEIPAMIIRLGAPETLQLHMSPVSQWKRVLTDVHKRLRFHAVCNAITSQRDPLPAG